MTSEENLSKLLRLKRYEQPPPGYFEDFLREFQARQRAELARPTFWETLQERLFSVVPTFQIPRLAYAPALAVALAASVFVMVRPSSQTAAHLTGNHQLLSLTSPQTMTIGEPAPSAAPSPGSHSVQYVLPSRPVKYASSRSF